MTSWKCGVLREFYSSHLFFQEIFWCSLKVVRELMIDTPWKRVSWWMRVAILQPLRKQFGSFWPQAYFVSSSPKTNTNGVVLLASPSETLDEGTSRLGSVGDISFQNKVLSNVEPIAVEINLRSPSILHGKKGFERIVWAFKNVLNHSMAWLFHDFDPTSHQSMAIKDVSEKRDTTDCILDAQSMPIAKHHPVNLECSPQQKTTMRVRVPDLSPRSSDSDDGFEDWALETYEWLSLVAMESPRICSEDAIDPFLSRYQVPDGDSEKKVDIVTLTWTGFIPAAWVRQVFIHFLRWADLRLISDPLASWQTRLWYSIVLRQQLLRGMICPSLPSLHIVLKLSWLIRRMPIWS